MTNALRIASLRARLLLASVVAKQARWPAGAPAAKGGQFAPAKAGAGAGGATSPAGGGNKPMAAPPDWAKLSQMKATTNPTPPPSDVPKWWNAGGKQSGFNAPQYGMAGGGHLAAPPAPPKGAKPHPKANDKGQPVTVNYPTKASGPETWRAPKALATFVPGGETPGTLNGVKMAPWTDHPTTHSGWANVEGQNRAVEAGVGPLAKVPGKHVAAGVIIEEPDGRVWLCRPTNSYGGYENTFPKGSAEDGHGLQATAIKEAFEETGLKIQITGVLGDYERSTSVARMFTAKRVGGTVKDMGWESQAMRLAPRSAMGKLLNTKLDRDIILDHFMESDLSKALGARLPVLPPSVIIMAAVMKAKGGTPSKGGAWEKQPRWPGGSPLGGQWKTYDGDGVLMPPKLGSEQNPVYAKKGGALYGLAKAGEIGALKTQVEALKAKVASMPAGKTPNFHDKQYAKLAQYGEALAGLQATTPKVTAQAASKDIVPETLTGYKKVGEKPGGTNPGGMYQAPNGDKWLAKGNAQYNAGAVTGALSDDRAKSEVLTAKLMQAVGTGAPDMKVVDFAGAHGTNPGKLNGGNLGVLSKWVAGGEAFDKGNPAHLAAAQADFAVHAWLANWDSIGLGYDNTKIIGGKAVCIDPGGALGFRAQGLPKYKDGKLPTTVSELSTLRDPSKNAQAAAVYGKMTPAQLAASAEKLKAIDDSTIKALVIAHGPGDIKAKADMAAALIARRDYVLATLGGGKAMSATPTVVVPNVAPPAPAVTKLPGTSSAIMGQLPNGASLPVMPKHEAVDGLSSMGVAVHTQNAKTMLAAAKTGDAVKILDTVANGEKTLKNPIGVAPGALTAVAANVSYGKALLAAMNTPTGAVPAFGGVVKPVHVASGTMEGLTKIAAEGMNKRAAIMADLAAANDDVGLKVAIKGSQGLADALKEEAANLGAGAYTLVKIAAHEKNVAYGRALLSAMNNAGLAAPAGPVKPVFEAGKTLTKNSAQQLNDIMSYVSAAKEASDVQGWIGALSTLKDETSSKGFIAAIDEAMVYAKARLGSLKDEQSPGANGDKPVMAGSTVFANQANQIANLADKAANIDALKTAKDAARGLQEASLEPQDVAGIKAVIGFIDAKMAAMGAPAGLPPPPDFSKIPDMTPSNAAMFSVAAGYALKAHGDGDIRALDKMSNPEAVGDKPWKAGAAVMAQYASDLALDLKEKAVAAAQGGDHAAMMAPATATPPASGPVKPTFGGTAGAMALHIADDIEIAHKASDVPALVKYVDALKDMPAGSPMELNHQYAVAAVRDIKAKFFAEGTPAPGASSIVAPSFNATKPGADKYYTDLAAKALKAYEDGDLPALQGLAKTSKGAAAWPAGTINGKTMGAFHTKLVADLEAKTGASVAAGAAALDAAAGFSVSSLPRAAKEAAIQGASVAPPMALPAKPNVSSPANPNAGLAVKLTAIEAVAQDYQAGEVTKKAALDVIAGYTFGSNTYGKAGAKYQAAVIAALSGASSPEGVVVSPAAAKAASAAPAPGKTAPKNAKLTAAEIPPPIVANTSKQWKKDANTAIMDGIKQFALAGNMAGLQAMTFVETKDDADGTKTGKTPPVSDHPSKAVVSYYDNIVQAMREKMYPPKPLQIFAVTKASTIEAVSKAFPPAPLKTSADKLPSNQKFGQWAALGQVPDPANYAPKTKRSLTTAEVQAGKDTYQAYSAKTKDFVSMIQSSSAMNHAYRAGKTEFNGVNLKELAKDVLKNATPMPEGTTIYRWQGMTDAMINSIKAAKPGLILDSLGPMCASYSPTATSNFGSHKINIIAAKGAKAIHSHGSGSFAGEKEVSIIPGSRFVFLGYKKNSGGNLEVDLLMLPPHDKLD